MSFRATIQCFESEALIGSLVIAGLPLMYDDCIREFALATS